MLCCLVDIFESVVTGRSCIRVPRTGHKSSIFRVWVMRMLGSWRAALQAQCVFSLLNCVTLPLFFCFRPRVAQRLFGMKSCVPIILNRVGCRTLHKVSGFYCKVIDRLVGRLCVNSSTRSSLAKILHLLGMHLASTPLFKNAR